MNNLKYTLTAIRLHWLIAFLIFTSFTVGLYMVGLPLSPQKVKIYTWHKWGGVTIFLLVVFRLLWRMKHQSPELPNTMPIWQRHLAVAGHHLLYLLMFAVPITGWLMSSAKGFQVIYFGILPIPDLLSKNVELGNALQEVHKLLNFLMMAVVAGHALAALKHHWIDRDDVLVRMLPFLKEPKHRRQEISP
ncbi:superoxide oxidase [Gammaproteobacteria bacterium]